MLAGWQEQIEAKVRQAQQLREAATAVRTSATSKDGSITTTVDHSGNLVDLKLTDAALRKRPDEVSAEILSTVRAAQSQLTDRMRDVMQPVVGDDSETMGAVLTGFRERFGEASQEDQAAYPDDEDEDLDGQSWMDDGKRR